MFQRELELKVLRLLMALKALKALKELKVLKALKELMALKVLKVLKVLKTSLLPALGFLHVHCCFLHADPASYAFQSLLEPAVDDQQVPLLWFLPAILRMEL